MGQTFEYAGKPYSNHDHCYYGLPYKWPQHNPFDDDPKERGKEQCRGQGYIKGKRHLGHNTQTHKSAQGHELACG